MMDVVENRDGTHQVMIGEKHIASIRPMKEGHVVYYYDGEKRVMPSVVKALAKILEKESYKESE